MYRFEASGIFNISFCAAFKAEKIVQISVFVGDDAYIVPFWIVALLRADVGIRPYGIFAKNGEMSNFNRIFSLRKNCSERCFEASGAVQGYCPEQKVVLWAILTKLSVAEVCEVHIISESCPCVTAPCPAVFCECLHYRAVFGD